LRYTLELANYRPLCCCKWLQ